MVILSSVESKATMPLVNSTPPLPWLDKAFAESILRNNVDNSSSLVVDAVHVTPANLKGCNYTSILHRVSVDCHDDASTHYRRHLLVKSLPEDGEFSKLLLEAGTYERETRIYEKTLPELRQILGETSGGFAVTTYPSGRPHTIIMDDLTAQGYKMVDKRSDGLDFEHCKLVMLSLARLHASSLIYCDRNPHVVEQYKERFNSPEFQDRTSAFYVPMFNKLIEEVATWPGYESYASKMRTSLTISSLVDIVVPLAGESLVITHGDPYVNNMLFHYVDVDDEHGNTVKRVDAVKLIDFQETRPGSPALDIEYVYATSLGPHVRAHRWTELLEIYHKEYCNIVRRSGEERLILEDMRTVDALKEAIATKGVFGLAQTSITLPLIFLEFDEAIDFGNAKIMNGDDEDVKIRAMYKKPKFLEAMKQMLEHFDETIWRT